MKPIIRDPSYWTVEAIMARQQEAIEEGRRAHRAKLAAEAAAKRAVIAVEVSKETAEAACANPRDVKVVTRDSTGVTRLEKPVVVEGTLRELERAAPKGYVLGNPLYYERQEEALRYRGSEGSVSHAYDPFAAVKE